MAKPQLLGMFPEELAQYLVPLGQPAFRAGQVFAWLHKGKAFAQMTNLPQALRTQLPQLASDQPVRMEQAFVSQKDGTEKFLFALEDGHCVEGVLMRYDYGSTLCISTQVGCRMGCAFCASTLEGCARDLTAAEMLGQVVAVASRGEDSRVHNIVLMGSGEPLENYQHTVRFLHLVSHPQGLNIGLRHISLSTCGLVPQMRQLAQEGLPVTLSVSLHAPNDSVRTQLMPIARRYPMPDLLDACRYYIAQTGRRVVFEYALIDGVNNLPQHAQELARRLRGMQCHVNLIPLNDVPERALRGVTSAQAQSFLGLLQAAGISATLRREMGGDIAGACGQLRRRYLKTPQQADAAAPPPNPGKGAPSP